MLDYYKQERSKVEGTVLQSNHSSSETTQHVEQEGADIKKLNEEILNLTHERDSYKKELDALQTHLEAAKVRKIILNLSVILRCLSKGPFLTKIGCA